MYFIYFFVCISPSSDEQPQQDLFSRIDPNKLNAALGNAAVLGKLEVMIHYLHIYSSVNSYYNTIDVESLIVKKSLNV